MKIFTAGSPPTPNGRLHLGHLAGPYLAADVIARAATSAGHQVTSVCGSDDFQSYTAVLAAQEGRPPQEVAAERAAMMRTTFRNADVHLDAFVESSASGLHRQLVGDALDLLVERDAFEVVERLMPFCETEQRVLYEAHISGTCPNCGSDADGNVCEVCGEPIDPIRLGNPRCARCGSRPVVHSVPALVFALERFRAQIEAAWNTTTMSPRAQVVCDRLASSELPTVLVAWPGSWGIPAPGRRAEMVVNPWVELPFGYITQNAVAHQGEHSDLKAAIDAWNDHDVIVQSCGLDNVFTHCVLEPALFAALELECRPADVVVVNEFLRLDGEKFSTSRNHAIWVDDALPQWGSDSLRLYLSAVRPSVERTNFTTCEIDAFIRTDIEGVWQPWIDDLHHSFRERHGGTIPHGFSASDASAHLDRVAHLVAYGVTGLQPQSFEPQATVVALRAIAESSRRLQTGTHDSVSKSVLDAADTAGARSLLAFLGLARPLVPGFVARECSALGIDPWNLPWEGSSAESVVSTGVQDASALVRDTA